MRTRYPSRRFMRSARTAGSGCTSVSMAWGIHQHRPPSKTGTVLCSAKLVMSTHLGFWMHSVDMKLESASVRLRLKSATLTW